MLVVVVLSSIQMFVLGMIGEYIGRLYIESKRRPLYLVADIAGTVHRRSHAPQLARFATVSTQAPLQQLCDPGHPRPGEQPVTQRLPTQSEPGAQCESVTQATH